MASTPRPNIPTNKGKEMLVLLIILGILFGYFGIGEFFLGWFCRMGTIHFRPGSTRRRRVKK